MFMYLPQEINTFSDILSSFNSDVCELLHDEGPIQHYLHDVNVSFAQACSKCGVYERWFKSEEWDKNMRENGLEYE